MFNLFILLFSGSMLYYCHGLPASVSEAHSAATQQLHLYIKNSTDGVSSELAPVVTQLKDTNEQVEVGRNAVLPFLSFLFDTLGDIGEEFEDCLDDMLIQLIPDDPTEPGFPTVPTVVTQPLEPVNQPAVPIIPPDAVKTDATPK